MGWNWSFGRLAFSVSVKRTVEPIDVGFVVPVDRMRRQTWLKTWGCQWTARITVIKTPTLQDCFLTAGNAVFVSSVIGVQEVHQRQQPSRLLIFIASTRMLSVHDQIVKRVYIFAYTLLSQYHLFDAESEVSADGCLSVFVFGSPRFFQSSRSIKPLSIRQLK